jgi:UV DNA damage endonuclease
MSIGYACLALGVLHTEYKTCKISSVTTDVLSELISYNLDSLERIIDYNIENNIKLFRISSDLIPFGSSPVNQVRWWEIYSDQFSRIGKKIKDFGMRVSLHPGQYTVINSPSLDVVKRAQEDLIYHARILESLGVDYSHKMVIHIGGVYGDKPEAMERFAIHFLELPENVRKRMIIENDDKSYNISDVLILSEILKIPVVFDNLHNYLNPAKETKADEEWIAICQETWKKQDGQQKIHYSKQDVIKKSGSHSFTINPDQFLDLYRRINRQDIDIMLEVKDKNLSALKLNLCLNSNQQISALEKVWEKYKYKVLEHSPEVYNQIRELLKDKNSYPVLNFFRLVDYALALELTLGHQINAIMHVWGYFKHLQEEKLIFQKRLLRFQEGKLSISAMKNYLFSLAFKENEKYLIQSYYFAF